MTIGERLKYFMRNKELEAVELAKLAEMDAHCVKKIISGETPNPGFLTLERLCQAMSLRLVDVLAMREFPRTNDQLWHAIKAILVRSAGAWVTGYQIQAMLPDFIADATQIHQIISGTMKGTVEVSLLFSPCVAIQHPIRGTYFVPMEAGIKIYRLREPTGA